MNSKPYVVLVGMDFSELADRALQQAFELASRHEHGEVHVLCVVPGLSVDACHALGGYFITAEVGVRDGVLESLRARVATALDAFRARSEPSSAKAPIRVVPHVRVDSPALGIALLAAEVSADLVVVGTHGRQSVPRVLMGSVAENTVRYAGCPVLVMPADTHTSRGALPRVVHVSAP
jgi:nucleotide-binding universal stress UspA family protein